MNCPVCQTDDNVAPLSISAGWNSAEIRFGDNGIHQVKLFACGSCRSVFIDSDTADKIMKKRSRQHKDI